MAVASASVGLVNEETDSAAVTVTGVDMRAFCSGTRVMTRPATSRERRANGQMSVRAYSIVDELIEQVGRLVTNVSKKPEAGYLRVEHRLLNFEAWAAVWVTRDVSGGRGAAGIPASAPPCRPLIGQTSVSSKRIGEASNRCAES